MKLLILLLLPLLAACNLTSAPVDSTPTPAPEAISVIVPDDLTQTYTDSVLNFTINYPTDWVLDVERPGDLIQFYSPDALTPQPGKSEGVPPGTSKIEFVNLSQNNPYTTIDEYIAFYEQGGDGPSGKMQVINRLTLDGDIPAARLLFTGGMADNVAVLVFEINGALVSVAGYEDTSRFDEILGTLRHSD